MKKNQTFFSIQYVTKAHIARINNSNLNKVFAQSKVLNYINRLFSDY